MMHASELDPIFHGAAIAPLSSRAFLRITGPDATRWLNGMVTNSTKDLEPGKGNYNFLLNAQGRIQGDCTIFRVPGTAAPEFLLATSAAQIETIHHLLDKFIIMDDVELDVVPSATTIVLVGPDARRVLRSLESLLDVTVSHAEMEPYRLASYPGSGAQIMTPAAGAVPCFEIMSTSPTETLLERAKEAGAIAVSEEALNAARIQFAVPAFGVDIREKDLPQETNQTQALHFNKGCYLGQEIVERIRSRGQVHRLFTKLELHGTLPASLPAPLESNGKPAGEITSAVQVDEMIYALGYVRREFLEAGAELTYGGGTASKR